MDTVKDGLGVHMNYTATGEHEPVSERNNHTFKDHIIPIYHYLPFRIIPKLTVSKTTTTSKNVWSGSIWRAESHPIIVPHVIMYVSWIYDENHRQITFDAYVQVFDEPKTSNTQLGRNIDTIYLKPRVNTQGGHVLMILNTREEVTTHKNVTELPITNVTIKAVECMASRQTTKWLNIQNINKVMYHPTDWIEVVEYKENDNNPNNPYMPETEANDYNIGFKEDMDLEEEEKHECI